MRDLDALIRERAYLIWEKSGKPSGRETDHWFQAAREIEAAMATDPFAVTAVEGMPAPQAATETPSKLKTQGGGQGEAGPAPAVKAAAAAKRMPLKMPNKKK